MYKPEDWSLCAFGNEPPRAAVERSHPVGVLTACPSGAVPRLPAGSDGGLDVLPQKTTSRNAGQPLARKGSVQGSFCAAGGGCAAVRRCWRVQRVGLTLFLLFKIAQLDGALVWSRVRDG